MSRNKRVRAGSIVVLICKADIRTSIRWYLNSTQPLHNDASSGIYVINGLDRTGGVATSQLQLAPVRLQNNGRYSCRSLHDANDNDTVVLTVRNNQQGTSFTIVVVVGVFCPKAGSFSLTPSFSVMCLFFQLCVINHTLFIFLHQCIQ